MKRRLIFWTVVGLFLWLLGPALARANGLLWTGVHWRQVSQEAKSAYIFGLGNLADFEVAGAKAAGATACVSQAVVVELKDKKVEQVVKEVDRFYQDNPDKVTTTVIEVILRDALKACVPEKGEAKK